ncbi:monooxygenase [Pigmentiphaga litoralis]|uniref:FAD-dependent monooxygenase n=1 Tax=Pigmentiphaga litoralis TaxID=516702 RepID=UPI00167C026E|nr:FAD-dependent monooxygenase [Pigmentiphaga litoralis]GGX17918.1 monooxygenase [Pigmentiphaga litoralis]
MNTSRSSASTIIVIGTGIAGLASALALARKDQDVALLGPKAPLPPARAGEFDPRVYAISPASQQFLAELGIWDLLPPDRVTPVDAMEVFGDAASASADALRRLPAPSTGRVELSAWQGGLAAMAWIVESRELERALRQAVQMFNIRWIADRYAGLERHAPDAPLMLRTANHASLPCGLAVGADGAESPLRESIGLPVTRSAYDATGLVMHLSVALPHQGRARQWFTPDGVLALLPMPDADGQPQVSMVWSMRTAKADALLGMDAATQRVAMGERLFEATGGLLGALTARTSLVGFPLALQTASQMVAPGVALVGDAAHLVHPLAGQGLNLGLGDAKALADTLAAREAYRNVYDLRVLRRYQRARAEPLLAMRLATDGLYRLFDSQLAPVNWLRNAGMNVVDRLPPLKRLLVQGASGR